MQHRLLIAVFCLTGVRLSNVRKDQTEEMRDDLSLLIRRFNNLEEAMKEKDNEIKELQEETEEARIENKELQKKIEEVRTENKKLQEKIEDIRNPPFGYFCGYKQSYSTSNSVITYDKLLYSSYFGLQGDSPGININTGKFVSGFSGTWRVDFSLRTYPDPGEEIEKFNHFCMFSA